MSKKAARLDDEIFAEKGAPVSETVAHAPARSAPAALATVRVPVSGNPTRQDAARSGTDKYLDQPAEKRPKSQKYIPTTIAFHPYIIEQLRNRLANDKTHNLRSLIYLGLVGIGIEIKKGDMAPERKRRLR